MVMTDNGRLNARDQALWDGYVLQGKTLMVLAEEHDISYQRVSQILKEIRESLPETDRSERVNLRLEQIAAGLEALMPGVTAGDKDSIASWKILTEREARLLGLDTPAKVEVSGGVKYEIVNWDDGA